jgi:hypothetical protein
MRSHTHKPLTRRRAIVALSAVTLLVSACGSAGDDDAQADAVASLRDVSTSDGATTDGTDGSAEDTELEAPDDLEEAMALYDQCLQDHGVDPGQGFVVSAGGDTVAVAPAGGATTGNELSDDQVFVDAQDADGKEIPPPDEDLIEAAEACRGHLANATPDFDLSPEQEAAMEDAQLDFQQCMEDHGIEGGGFSISVGGGGPGLAVVEHEDAEQAAPPPSDIDPEQFQAAAEECQSVYDDYPELRDVFPDGGPVGGVPVAHAESVGGS